MNYETVKDSVSVLFICCQKKKHLFFNCWPPLNVNDESGWYVTTNERR